MNRRSLDSSHSFNGLEPKGAEHGAVSSVIMTSGEKASSCAFFPCLGENGRRESECTLGTRSHYLLLHPPACFSINRHDSSCCILLLLLLHKKIIRSLPAGIVSNLIVFFVLFASLQKDSFSSFLQTKQTNLI